MDDVVDKRDAKIEELQRTVERLRQESTQSCAQSSFINVISHELRTPMNGVLGMASLLKDTGLDEKQHRLIDELRKSGQHLLTLINDMLDYTRLAANLVEPEFVDFSLRELGDSVVDLVRESAEAKGLKINFEPDRDMVDRVIGDAGRFRQMLFNIISNAVKFTEKGSVTLVVSAREQGDGTVALVAAIRDTGVGFDKAKLPDPFDAFSQGDVSNTRRFDGIGIGLAIARRVALLMGGEIRIDSHPGEGTIVEFRVTLRAVVGDTSLEMGDHDMPVASVADMRALMVSRDPLSGGGIAGRLGEYGISCELWEAPAEALAEIRRAAAAGTPYDMALFESPFEDQDALTCLKALTGDDTLAHTRLVFIAGAGFRGDAQRAKALGFDAYFIRPISQEFCREAFALIAARRGEPRGGSLITRHSLRELKSRGRRILLAEDNRVNQMVIARMLERAGHRVDLAANGLEVIIAVGRCDYDVVLMDVRMPEMDGAEATRRLRALGMRHGDVPIIALASKVGPEERTAFVAGGFDDCLRKPFSDRQVLDAIESWAGRKSSHAVGPPPAAAGPEYGTASGSADSPGDPRGDGVVDPTADAALSSAKARILIAEDSRVNRIVVTRMLENAGHDVETAVNGAEAVDAAEGSDFDIVLMDIRMPEMDGIEATRRIRDFNSARKDVPIVALTANSVDGERDRYVSAGFDDCMEKPISEADLFDLIERWTNKRAAADLAAPL